MLINEEDILISFQDRLINTVGITTDSKVAKGNLSRFIIHDSQLKLVNLRLHKPRG
jgi:hypothetical protein